MVDVQTYPDGRSMVERWRDLAAKIASAGDTPEPHLGRAKGSLVILGSGLAHVDLTADTQAELLSADHVFYCLYDRVSQIWISRLRPDALDMTLLYTPGIDRYFTYMRMAEAMLYYVRQGQKVVAVYYGHPGVFAMPTHRAIAIARREGHSARMRPGVSALDYLVADLGFDPALPGLQTYEATDMLLRRRPIDTGLHVVLWQVGVVGEFGFSPGGFENHGFDILVDELERAYGADWPVVHYIAAQYVGIAPLVEHHTVQNLRHPAARAHISPLSTFYIEPQAARPTDQSRSVELKLSTPEAPVHPPQRLFQSFDYGAQEVEAIRSFGAGDITTSYEIPRWAPAAEFMFELSQDVVLQEQYRQDPAAVLNDARFDYLPERARRLLAIAHPWAISTAMSEGEGAPQL